MKKNELAARLIWAFYAWVSRAVPITAPILQSGLVSRNCLGNPKPPARVTLTCVEQLHLASLVASLLGIHGEICLVVWSAEGTN